MAHKCSFPIAMWFVILLLLLNRNVSITNHDCISDDCGLWAGSIQAWLKAKAGSCKWGPSVILRIDSPLWNLEEDIGTKSWSRESRSSWSFGLAIGMGPLRPLPSCWATATSWTPSQILALALSKGWLIMASTNVHFKTIKAIAGIEPQGVPDGWFPSHETELDFVFGIFGCPGWGSQLKVPDWKSSFPLSRWSVARRTSTSRKISM